jgi:hypothetical protein
VGGGPRLILPILFALAGIHEKHEVLTPSEETTSKNEKDAPNEETNSKMEKDVPQQDTQV